MKIAAAAKLVSIYVHSTDRWHGQALYAAIVRLCKDRGIAGASVTRGAEGYRGGGRTHAAGLLEFGQKVPVHIEIVDIAQRIEPLLAALEPMLGAGLVTVTDVQALRFLKNPASDADAPE